MNLDSKERSLDNISDFVAESLSDDNLTAKEIYEKLIEEVALTVEYHKHNYKKSQEFFNLLREGNSKLKNV
jgi:hypothetical protein